MFCMTQNALKETRLTDAGLIRGHSSQVPCIRYPMLPPSLIQLIHNMFHPTNPNTCTKATLANHKFDHKARQCLDPARAWRTPGKQAQLVACNQPISMLSVRGFYSGYWRSPSSHSTHLRRAYTAPFWIETLATTLLTPSVNILAGSPGSCGMA
jgi:hypothetical protein